ncbi:MAG: nucleotide exchange factor GrpE [Patescibacteria group bacterium]|nr:nucleotide exchange factor GrpE [Patescibacteria group bacterium]
MNDKKNACEEADNIKISTKLVLHDPETNKFLLAKRKSGKKTWGFVGGTINGSESLFDTLAREVEEEIGSGVQYIIDDIVYAKRRKAQDGCGEYVKIAYLATYSGGEIILSEEHKKYEWVDAEKIAKGKYTPWVKECVEKALVHIEQMRGLDGWQRTLADFDNYKKRQAEQQKEFTKYAAEGVISDMLPVLDNFHAATDHIPEGEADNPWVTGIMFIQQQMEKVFEDNGVSLIEVKIGDEFDPTVMEAIKENEDAQTNSNASVQKIAQPGYKIGEKVLRPVRVVLK